MKDLVAIVGVNGLLHAAHIHPREAADGHQAFELVRALVFDVLLLDMSMPGRSGVDLIRQIKAEPRWATLRTVALTGRNRQDDVRAAAEAGFDTHLSKPLDFGMLLAALGDTH